MKDENKEEIVSFIAIPIEEIISKNYVIKKEYEKLNKILFDLKKSVIAPCQACKYDGVFRCEACEDNFYEGYNEEHYPDINYSYGIKEY